MYDDDFQSTAPPTNCAVAKLLSADMEGRSQSPDSASHATVVYGPAQEDDWTDETEDHDDMNFEPTADDTTTSTSDEFFEADDDDDLNVFHGMAV